MTNYLAKVTAERGRLLVRSDELCATIRVASGQIQRLRVERDAALAQLAAARAVPQERPGESSPVCTVMRWCEHGCETSRNDPAACVDAETIVAWIKANSGEARISSARPNIVFRTASGWAHAKPGDYIAMGGNLVETASAESPVGDNVYYRPVFDWLQAPGVRLAVDAHGYVWRFHPKGTVLGADEDMWSMAPVDPSSGAIPQPVTWFEPVGDS